MEKIPRAFTTGRHAQRRDLIKACRTAVKGTKWRSSSGTLLAQRSGWFLAMQEMTSVLRDETKARITVKPMAVDPVFWDMVGEPQLRSQPLSFRYFGAVSCPGLILAEIEINEDGGPPAIAARMLDHAEKTLEDIASSWTIEKFLDRVRSSSNPQRLLATVVATLIAVGREDEALRLSQDSARRGQVAGFLSRRGTFPEMALKHIQSEIAAG